LNGRNQLVNIAAALYRWITGKSARVFPATFDRRKFQFDQGPVKASASPQGMPRAAAWQACQHELKHALNLAITGAIRPQELADKSF
jgi:hypothetical protein